MALYFDSARSRYRIDIDRRLPDGERVRKTKMLPAGISREQAQAMHDKMDADLFVRSRMTVPVDGWPQYVEQLMLDPQSWLHRTVRAIRTRTKRRGGSANFTANDLKELMLRSRGRCQVTGIAFHVHGGTPRRRPFYHSVDRIDSTKGYIPGNMRIVCHAVNIAMLHWGEDVFGQIAIGWVVNRYCAFGLLAELRV